MAAFDLTGSVLVRQRGCSEGAGQDYVWFLGDEGSILVLHPAFDTSGLILPQAERARIAIDLLSIGQGWELSYNNLTIQFAGQEEPRDTFVCSAGANALSIHPLHSYSLGTVWQAGLKLNCGILRL